MDNLGVLLGIVSGLVLGAYLRHRHPARGRLANLSQFALIILVATVAGILGGVGEHYLRLAAGTPSAGDVDKAMAAIRQQPLIGLVISESPALEGEVRSAAEAELRNPAKTGPDRLWQLGASIRQRFIIPALRKASDEDALNAVKAFQDLASHLQRTSVPLCSELGKRGMQRPDKLDRGAQEIFKRTLETQEIAYRNGKTASPRPLPSDDQVGQLFVKAGYQERDFEGLRRLEQLSDADACAATVKLYGAPSRLSPQEGGVLARYILTIS
ncbi:MAG: hypothetical protein AB7F22_18665 [Reyranella sp.]|uniref:hypothetical protein n=1 Tax=Reyranella sp. TaxID=1929291 RepID=UPI003D105FD9